VNELMTSSDPSDGALAETAAGAVQGGGMQDATDETEPATRGDEPGASESDAGDFVVDREADPPEEVQPTTS
jgi:hypothetical protein